MGLGLGVDEVRIWVSGWGYFEVKVWVGLSLGVGEGRIGVSGAGFVLLCERMCEWVW